MPTPPKNGPAGLSQTVQSLWRRRSLLLQAAVIVLAGCWVFSPAINGGWLWDDQTEILQNPDLRDQAGIW